MSSSCQYHEGVTTAKSKRAALRADCYRPRILRVLREASGPLTLAEIAQQARCARITARRQIKALVEEQLVASPGSRQRVNDEGLVLPSKGPYLYIAVE
jgi:predicted transcriptional regulator